MKPVGRPQNETREGTLHDFERNTGRGISWKAWSNFVIQPRPKLFCVLQYQSDLWCGLRASALIRCRLDVCRAQQATFHLAQNAGPTLASVIRWLTIITLERKVGRKEREGGKDKLLSEELSDLLSFLAYFPHCLLTLDVTTLKIHPLHLVPNNIVIIPGTYASLTYFLLSRVLQIWVLEEHTPNWETTDLISLKVKKN